MRLFWRILLGYWLAWALLSAGLFGTLTLVQNARWLPRPAISMARPTGPLIANVAINLRFGGEPLFRSLARTWPRGEPPFVVDAAGHELLGREVDNEALEAARALADRGDEPAPAKWVETPEGATYVVFFPQGRGPLDRTIWHWLFAWPWLFAVVLAAASLLFAGGLALAWTRPIGALKAAFDALAEGRLETRVGAGLTRRRDEIGDLGRHFDVMAGRLAQSAGAQRQLLHDVSHELRSPLARLGVAVELARHRPERAAEALDRIEKENQRLDRLIGEVLTLARLEAGAADAREDYVDLVELLRVVAEDARFEAGAAGVAIEPRLPPGEELVLRGNGELLHRALDNVVRNALKHAADSDRIEIELTDERASGRVRFRVRDHGEGVEEAALVSLFEPFQRASGSTGFGLGLTIARRAVEVHGGTIHARNHPEGGLEVAIELPAAPT